MRTELAIIGAGPAGLAAAEFATSCGIKVCIIDEQARPGGQIYRQPPASFKVQRWLSSRVYRDIGALVSRVSQLEQIQWLTRTTVLGITHAEVTAAEGNYRLTLNDQQHSFELDVDSVLIAPGCYDMPVLFPGWNLPGVMATGGIQAFVKSQQIVPGERFLFAGTHPLQLIVADQIQQAGGEVAGILFAQPLSRLLPLFKSPWVLLRHSAKLLYIFTTLLRLLKRRTPIRFAATVTRAQGDTALQSVTTATITAGGKVNTEDTKPISCDRLGLCFGFLASSELGRQAGAEYRWSATDGGWLIKHDEWMCSNRKGLYVAGEITGVAGADCAIQEGVLAGIGIALELNKITLAEAQPIARKVRRKLRSLNRFADLLKQLADPGKELLLQLLTEQTTLCKCEEVSLGEFDQQLSANPNIGNSNAAKLYSRAGMGLCQGRYCNYYISRLMADRRGIDEADSDAFTARFPAKPVRIGDLLTRESGR